ncbi:peptide ABC transporter substrate-binding protein [Neobacillus vireti]|uniref:peptide ABC transporter substrate-binding protein n=1 Tax=Neobacillus vireti TaxID=220686 RepID=UPI002FFD6CC2
MRNKQISILFILILVLTACTSKEKSKEHLGEIYSIALDAMMEKDKALNSEMEFIAINMSTMKELSSKDKEEIIEFFEGKYGVEVMDADLENLKEQGLYESEKMAIRGVLLSFETVIFKYNNTVVFEGSKYHSALGAIGVEITVHFKDGKWQIKEVNETWIS